MRDSFWTLFILLTLGTIRGGDSTQTNSRPTEVFCTEGAALFYVSADKDVTSPPTKTRLRILRLQDGKLLLNAERQLVYPVVPNVTPVFLSEQDKLIMLPDLEKRGAAIGLQVPESLLLLVHQLLHQPPPPENVAQVLSRADSLASQLVQRAEAVGGVISEKVASLQAGTLATPGPHPRWRAGAQYAREMSERVVGVTSKATNLVGKAIEKVGQAVRPPRPKNSQTREVDTVGNTKGKNGNKPVKYVRENLTDNMATATVKAFDKITEALRKSAGILATSLKENTVKVVQHKFGEDLGEAVGDVMESVKNTAAAAQHIADLRVENIARRAVKQVIAAAPGKPTQDSCKQDL